MCNKKSHAIQALPAYWSEKVPKMWTLEIQGIFCPSLRDLQLVLEIPGNLPINYDNLPFTDKLEKAENITSLLVIRADF